MRRHYLAVRTPSINRVKSWSELNLLAPSPPPIPQQHKPKEKSCPICDADPAAVESARSLGMTEGQILQYIRFPLAIPVIMAGVRTAAVITVGTAPLAAFIGAGGLGDPIVAGLALSDSQMIPTGAIPAAALAFLVDGALGVLQRVVTPAGLEVGS